MANSGVQDLSCWYKTATLCLVLCMLQWKANTKPMTGSRSRQFSVGDRNRTESCGKWGMSLSSSVSFTGINHQLLCRASWLQFCYCPQTLKVLIRLYSSYFDVSLSDPSTATAGLYQNNRQKTMV